MKKMILSVLALTLVGAGIQSAKAGDCGWSTAGKILTGVVAGVAISQALAPPPPQACYPAPAYSYCPPAPVVVAPAPPPVVYVPAPPVVVYRAPVVAPAPVASFRFGYGAARYYRHDRW